MAEHTPGPWKLNNLGPRIRRFHIFGPNHEGIADVFHSPDNALLIAAAPDLLVACRAVILWGATDQVRYVLGSNYDKAFGPVRAAIAKAEIPHPATCGCELCQQCGSSLTQDGYCTDETCPYSDCLQTATYTED